MKVRVFQPSRDVKRFGKRKAPWHIEWRDPATGRKLSRHVGSRKQAVEAADAKHIELTQRTFGLTTDKPLLRQPTRSISNSHNARSD